MKNIICFTRSSAIIKHWTKALEESYIPECMKDIPKLQKYLEKNKENITLMLDEQSVNDIYQVLEKLELYPHVSILVFNSTPQVYHASVVISKNVKGYENAFLHKTNLLHMLESTQKGKKWLFPDLTHYIINRFIQDSESKEPDFIVLLTPKETEIAYMVADGCTNKEIAQSESIALSTVKNHMKKIFEKSGVTDRVSLALKFK